VLRPNHTADELESISLTDLRENLEESIPRTDGPQQKQPVVTSKPNELQIPLSITALRRVDATRIAKSKPRLFETKGRPPCVSVMFQIAFQSRCFDD
jgi:hypothetical protein